jgi:pSer/pThr/pTyr-binding forkhead associated (FHA) protein
VTAMAKLINTETKEERELLKAVTLLGRAEYCDVRVNKPLVSREHARIVRKLLGYYIEDLGSANGTRVNSVRIEKRAKLHDGDVITVAMLRSAGHGSAMLLAPRTDTTVMKARAQAAEPPASEGGEQVVGATFIFRK